MFQATVRRDGSSVFGKDNRWATFPSFSAAWNITEESFMENQELFDNLKLRAPPLSYHSITINEGGRYRRVTALFPLDLVPEVLRSDFISDSTAAVFYSTYIERLRAVVQASSPTFYEPLASSLMVNIFYDMLEAARSSTSPDKDDFLQRTVHYIDQHLGEKISLDELARETSRSKSSFSHLFEEKMSISPKQYILHKKLATARKLISEGVPPTTASAQVGYENYSSFYRLYIKHYGVAPTKRNSPNSPPV